MVKFVWCVFVLKVISDSYIKNTSVKHLMSWQLKCLMSGQHAKGKDPKDESGVVARPPSKVRPLNLSNTDSKHMSAMATDPLVAVGKRCVAAFQSM